MTTGSARRAGVDSILARGEQILRSEGGKAPLFLRRLREEGLAAFGRLGFPAAGDEEWRYTNVAPIAEGAFTPSAASISPRERAEERGHVLSLDGRLGPMAYVDRKKTQIVFVNGRFAAEWSSVEDLPAGVRFEPLSAALERIESEFGDVSEVVEFITFIRQSKIGINPARSQDRQSFDIH